MTCGLFVWAGGRWCELNSKTGRVRGWRSRARFVFKAQGRLHVASSGAVLRGLRSLLAGQPSTVRDGAPLSQRRQKHPSVKSKAHCDVSTCHQHCCGANHSTSCTINNTEAHPKIHIDDQPRTVEAGVQVTLSSHSQTVARTPPSRAKRKRSTSSETHVIKRQVQVQIHRSSSEEPQRKTTQGSSDIPLAQKHTNRTRDNLESSSQKQSQLAHCKELIINEDDVDIYRSYLIENHPEFDVYRFDTDEEYKLRVFFRINPLVNVERCVRIERMLRDSQSSQMTLKDFATKLGLTSVSDQESERRFRMKRRAEKLVHELSSEGDNDKENQSVRSRRDRFSLRKVLRRNVEARSDLVKSRKRLMQVQQNKKRDGTGLGSESRKETKDVVVGRVNSTTSDSDFVKGKVPRSLVSAVPVKKVPAKASLPTVLKSIKRRKSLPNSYSSLEDHAIVSWVSCGPRARQVNGNRIWRELQPQFERLTGHKRTWHSLRNRYLRYILPALPALALPPAHAQRLRAAAAAGFIKTKGGVSRRNSIFSYPPVRSAFAAKSRQRPQGLGNVSEASEISDSQSTRRVLRSSAVHESPTRPGRTSDRAKDKPNQSGSGDRKKKNESPVSSDSDFVVSKDQTSVKVKHKSVLNRSKTIRSDSSDRKVQRSKSDGKVSGRRDESSDSNSSESKSGWSSDRSDDRSRNANRSSSSNRLRPTKSDNKGKSIGNVSRSSDGRFRPIRLDGKEKNRARDLSSDRRNRSSGSAKFLERSDRDKSDDRRASLRDKSSRTPTYDQLTRHLSARLRSTPNDTATATKSQEMKQSHRTRKLYNPNAVMR